MIDSINNKQIGIAMQYVWYPVMNSSSGDALVKMGKSATKDLVSVLSDTTKGIIAHFILSSIWNDEIKKAGWKVGSRVDYIENNLDSVNRIYLSGLTFYQDNNFRLFVGQDELNRNKKEWLTFIATKSSPHRRKRLACANY
ncbi:MAG: hypothetical protein QM725_03320 [Lacibacter sp.]